MGRSGPWMAGKTASEMGRTPCQSLTAPRQGPTTPSQPFALPSQPFDAKNQVCGAVLLSRCEVTRLTKNQPVTGLSFAGKTFHGSSRENRPCRRPFSARSRWTNSAEDLFWSWARWTNSAEDLFWSWARWTNSAEDLFWSWARWTNSAEDLFWFWARWTNSAEDLFRPWARWASPAEGIYAAPGKVGRFCRRHSIDSRFNGPQKIFFRGIRSAYPRLLLLPRYGHSETRQIQPPFGIISIPLNTCSEQIGGRSIFQGIVNYVT